MKDLLNFTKRLVNAPLPDPLFTETINGITYELLAIEQPFQVERVTAPAGIPVPEHCHDNLDAVEIYVGGDLAIMVDGKPLPVSDGKPRPFLGGRKAVLIPRGTTHGPGVTGLNGFTFLSIQKHDGVPQVVPGCPHRRFVAHA